MSTSISYKGSTIASFSNDTKTLTTQGKYLEADVIVTDASASPSLQNKTVTPTTSQQSVTADSGYDGLGTVTVNAMPSGSATTPATSITANPSISVSSGGLITATTSASKSITPTVSAGYVASGTAGTVSVSGSNTSQLTTQAATTYTPTTSDQTIASGKYLTGAQTIKGDANLVAANIKKDVSLFGVTGTYEGGGGGIPGLTGSFTTQASTGVQTINIPYTGNGYPVSVQITIDGGAWSKSSFTKGEIQFASLVKEKPEVTPTYSGAAANGAGVLAVYASDIYGSKGYIYSDSSHYTSNAPTTGNPLRVSAKNQIKVYVSAASGTNGFLANQKYNYSIVYSE